MVFHMQMTLKGKLKAVSKIFAAYNDRTVDPF